MYRKKRAVLGLATLSLLTLVVGCGTQSQADLTSKFMTVDSQAKSVNINLVAGYTEADSQRNFNGYSNGAMTITVPVGYKVNLNYYNNAGLPVDVGVYTHDRQLAFKGAGDSVNSIFLNAAAGLLPGKSEQVSFTASQVGAYQIANLLDRFPQLGNSDNAYQAVDMWDGFNVVSAGSPSISTK